MIDLSDFDWTTAEKIYSESKAFTPELKVVEECSELCELLTKEIGGRDIESKRISEELSDVLLRVLILSTAYNEHAIQARMEEKLAKLAKKLVKSSQIDEKSSNEQSNR